MNMQSRTGLVVIVEYSVLREQVCRVKLGQAHKNDGKYPRPPRGWNLDSVAATQDFNQGQAEDVSTSSGMVVSIS